MMVAALEQDGGPGGRVRRSKAQCPWTRQASVEGMAVGMHLKTPTSAHDQMCPTNHKYLTGPRSSLSLLKKWTCACAWRREG